MRKISRILGIIGSILALAAGIFAIIDACYYTFMDSLYGYSDYYYYDSYGYDALSATSDALPPLPPVDNNPGIEPYINPTAILYGCAKIVGGLLGVAGAVFAKRHNVAAGILFILAAVLNVLSSAIIAGALFVIAAVFALKKEHPPMPPVAWLPPYPYNAHPTNYQVPYPPYPYADPTHSGAYPPPYPSSPNSTPVQPETAPYPYYGTRTAAPAPENLQPPSPAGPNT